MIPSMTRCPERIGPETLAAWRDGTLSSAQAAHLDTHVPQCPACRAALDASDALDASLRRYPAPDPDERLWNAVRDRMHGAQTQRQQLQRAQRSPRRIVGGLGALAAVVLLALGFAQVLHSHMPAGPHTGATVTVPATMGPLPTAVAPSLAVPGPRPNWQQAQLPVSPLSDQDILTFAVAPGNGESAYACHAISDSSGATLTFYRTTDRALHWTQLKQLTAPGLDVSDCAIQVDALDGSRVLAQVMGQDMQTLAQVTWYELSEDGGAHWTRLDQSAPINDLATLNGTTYALRQVVVNHIVVAELFASTDQLRTWQRIDQTLAGANQMVDNFWLNPDGELLAEVETDSGAPAGAAATPSAGPSATPAQVDLSLWRSTDGGAHWSLFPVPSLSTSRDTQLDYFVQSPVAGQPWHICASYAPPGNSTGAALVCTFDGGRTWSARPLVCTTAPCTQPLPTDQYVMASDGAVLIMMPAPGSQSQLALYRLPRGATTWQYLGPLAGSNAFFIASTPAGGILWAFAGGEYATRLSGTIGGHQALPGVLATATYP